MRNILIPTLRDVLNFIIEHKKGKVFRGLTEEQIAHKLIFAQERQELSYTLTEDGQHINGVILYNNRQQEKILYINHWLCLDNGAVQDFVKTFRRLYPNYTLQACRDGKVVTYKNTNRLCHLLTKTFTRDAVVA